MNICWELIGRTRRHKIEYQTIVQLIKKFNFEHKININQLENNGRCPKRGTLKDNSRSVGLWGFFKSCRARILRMLVPSFNCFKTNWNTSWIVLFYGRTAVCRLFYSIRLLRHQTAVYKHIRDCKLNLVFELWTRRLTN